MKMAGERVFHLDVLSVKLNVDYTLFMDEVLDNPSAVAIAAAKLLKDRDREAVVIFNLNSSGKPVSAHVASIGTLNASLAHPRELLKASILSNADSIIIAHNHPSGNTNPSKEDIELTKRMADVCNLIQIPLVDHVIIGGRSGNYLSMYEKGIIRKKSPAETVIDEAAIARVAERSFCYGKSSIRRDDRKSKVL